MENGVLQELLHTFGGRFKSHCEFAGVPLSETMLQQLALLHDAELLQAEAFAGDRHRGNNPQTKIKRVEQVGRTSQSTDGTVVVLELKVIDGLPLQIGMPREVAMLVIGALAMELRKHPTELFTV